MKKATLLYLYFLAMTAGFTLVVSILLRLLVNWLLPSHPMYFWEAWFLSTVGLLLVAFVWWARDRKV